MALEQTVEKITPDRISAVAGERNNPLNAKDLAFLNKRMGEIAGFLDQGASRAAQFTGMPKMDVQNVIGQFTGALAAAGQGESKGRSV